MAVTAVDPRGLKRICTSCGSRFYDMNKRPVVCPSCSAEYTGDYKARGRKARGGAEELEEARRDEGQVAGKGSDATNDNDDDDDDEMEIDDGGVVSLDDLDEDFDDDDDDDLDLEADLDELDDMEEIDEDLDEEALDDDEDEK